MALPSQKEFHRPVLEILGRSNPPSFIRQIMDETAVFLQLSDPDKQETEANGALKWEKRVRWAAHNLKNYGGLVESPAYRQYRITESGRKFLSSTEGVITIKQLIEDRERLAQPQLAAIADEDIEAVEEIDSSIIDETDATPDELIQAGYRQLRDAVFDELHGAVNSLDHTQFELLAIALLEKMGYGKGEHTGGRGDGGIDGVLRQDPLGLGSVCCVQAKRWGQAVGDDVIRTFSGSIERFGSSLGVIVTTDRFTSTAIETARAYSVGNKVIRLIGGQDLIQLMLSHGVGVVTEDVYEIKRVDTTYFERF